MNASDNEETTSEEEENVQPIPGARKNVSNVSNGDDTSNDDASSHNEQNFIVEDDGKVEYVLPDQFSNTTTQPEERAFKVIFQLFVLVACQSPQLREEYMKMTINGMCAVFQVRCARVLNAL